MQHKVLDSSNFGIPQFRERIFIVGNRMGMHFKFPTPTHGDRAPQESLFASNGIEPLVTVWDAIGNLPKAEEPSDVAKRVSGTIKERIEKHGY